MDLDSTPRKTQRPADDALRTPRPPFDLAALTLPALSPSPSAPSPTATASETSSDPSRKRKRTTSPTKSLSLLRDAPYKMAEGFITSMASVPEPMRPLTRRMRTIGSARGILSDQDDETLVKLVTDGTDDDAVTAPSRLALGGGAGVELVRNTLDHIIFNISESASEAAWNCTVHAPLLETAWQRSAYRQYLRWHTITTAGIEPVSLLPVRSAGKRADFCISLVIDEAVKDGLIRSGVQTLSQSSYRPIQWSPVAVTFETKLPGENWTEANVQLLTWALAQVTKLRQLLAMAGREDVAIPALPLVVVQGDAWTFLYLEVASSQVTLWKHIRVADGVTPKAVYQAYTAIQELMHWAATVYRPWLYQNVLDPILKRTLVPMLPPVADGPLEHGAR